MKVSEGLSRRRLKEISSLSSSKHRELHGRSVVEGFRSVKAAIAGGAEIVEIIVTSGSLEGVAGLEAVAALDVPVSVVSSKDFDRLSSVKTAQGVLAVVRTGWVSVAVLGGLGRIIALDGVQDPGNVGTIIRTAAWMGVDGVLSGPGTADIYSPKVLRASMGGVWEVGVARCESLRGVLEELAASGHHLAAADFGGTDVRKWKPVTPGVLILGNEGAGISREVLSLGPELVTVPAGSGAAATESLNVAVASAIIMHRWCHF